MYLKGNCWHERSFMRFVNTVYCFFLLLFSALLVHLILRFYFFQIWKQLQMLTAKLIRMVTCTVIFFVIYFVNFTEFFTCFFMYNVPKTFEFLFYCWSTVKTRQTTGKDFKFTREQENVYFYGDFSTVYFCRPVQLQHFLQFIFEIRSKTVKLQKNTHLQENL